MAIVDRIVYNGGPDVFAWKYPSEQIVKYSQLVVHDSQEAVFYKGGQALDLFGPGTYQLTTENLPLLHKVIGAAFGGNSPFVAEVWFVNKAFTLDVKWGTATPVQLQDPKFGIFVPVRSFGQFGIQIEDTRKFLAKLVGKMPQFGRENLISFFRGLYLTKVKDAISSYLVHKQVGVLEINAYIDEMSTFMSERIAPTMAEYGIRLVNFYINDLSVPEDDPSVVKLKEALSKKAEMDIIGYSYDKEQSYGMLRDAAANPGGAGSAIMGAGIGLGMGPAIGRTMAGQVGGIGDNIGEPCPRCGGNVPVGKQFCPDCGNDVKSGGGKDAVKCSKCGETIPPTAKFCPGCGDAYNPCPGCGQDIHLDAAQCPACGYELPAPCPECGKPVGAGVKFCPECGAGLEKKCPKCENPINGNPKFCPECGEKLGE